jgi:hypothetical protein
MGVELGKVLAKAILAQLERPEDVKGHDSSVRSVTFIIRVFLGTVPDIVLISTDDGTYSLLSEV